MPFNPGKVIAFVLRPINLRQAFRLINFHLFLSKKIDGVNSGGNGGPLNFPPEPSLDSPGRSRL
jgi:hypothetical protein